MADDIERESDNEGTSENDKRDAFIARMEEEFADEDAKTMDDSDGVVVSSKGKAKEKEVEDDADDDDAEDAEHAAAGTSDDNPDGDAAESDDDSDEDDDAEHPGDELDSDDDADAADADDDSDEDAKDDDDEEDEATSLEATKTALLKAGADVKLEDVPEKYRPLVSKKLASVDAAFTRVMQEQTSFRKERTEFRAEERFRKENLPLYIVEQLRKDPKLMDAVNGELDKLGADNDSDEVKQLKGKAFDESVQGKRKAVRDATEQEYTAAVAKVEKAAERGVEVDKQARKMSDKAGVPFRIVEKQILLSLQEKRLANADVDLTDKEIADIVAVEAAEFRKITRKTARESSREVIKARADNRRGVPPTAKNTGAATPGPKGKQKVKVDHNSEESRQAAMMRTAARLMPGAR